MGPSIEAGKQKQLQGHGMIVNTADITQTVHCKNYKSILDPSVINTAESQMKSELEAGNYLISTTNPKIVSSFGSSFER